MTNKSADGESKKKDKSAVECYTCGKMGHYARECKKRKSTGKALVAKSIVAEDCEQGEDEDDLGEEEVAYVTLVETVLFTRNDVLLDSQASVSVFCNRDLLSNVRESAKKVVLNVVQAKASGVTISQEGDFNEVGKCYFSKDATANILSYAVMVDEGNNVSHDKKNDRFIFRPARSSMVYSFCSKNISGSEGRFYCCDVATMVKERPTKYPDSGDHVMIETVQNTLLKYTKREIADADKARLLLGKMGYLSVRNAIGIATKGVNFDVTARDFAIAEDIHGMDVASLKGKTKKMASTIADLSIGAATVQVEQILSVDVMFVEGVPSLIGLATSLELTIATTLSAYDTVRTEVCTGSEESDRQLRRYTSIEKFHHSTDHG